MTTTIPTPSAVSPSLSPSIPPRLSPARAPRMIRIAASSSPYNDEALQRGIQTMQNLFPDALVIPHQKAESPQLSYLCGDDQHRAQELLTLLMDPNTDVIWLARGGYGLTRILRLLDLDRVAQIIQARMQIQKNMPVIVGFSDVTALLLFLLRVGQKYQLPLSSIPAIHGPLATTIANEPDAVQNLVKEYISILANTHTSPVSSISPVSHISGWACAVNLCVFVHLLGTPYMPDLSGAVLLLEDVGEKPYRIDRMLTQLLDAGILQNIKALVLGTFSKCDAIDADGLVVAPSVMDVVLDRLQMAREIYQKEIPVFALYPFGHTTPNHPICMGYPVDIYVDQRGCIQLEHMKNLYPLERLL